MLIFIHIPKTGGTSLAKIISKQYKPTEFLYVVDSSTITKAKINQNIKCLWGHQIFGQQKDLGPCIYITMLRNPVDRVISHYYYAKNVLKDNDVARYSLEEFAQINWVTNLQTKYLAGGIENLEQAISNLKTFAFFGITEMFTESLTLMKKTFGWDNIQYTKENVNEKRQKRETLPNETIEKIKRANFLDVQLYDWAKEHFEELVRTI